MRLILWVCCCLLCWSCVGYAQTTEKSSKIEGYGVLNSTGPSDSKLEGYGVLDRTGPAASKVTGYAVLCCAGPAVSKIDSNAVLQSLVVPYAEDLSKLESYAVLLDPVFPPAPSPPTPPCSVPSIDFSVWNYAYPFKFGSPATVSVTSKLPNEIIYVTFSSIDFDTANNTPPVVSSISDAASLTWARQGVSKVYSCTAGTGGCFPGDRDPLAQVRIDTFWAYSPGILTGDLISVNFTTTGASGNARWNLNAVGVINVGNFVAPFDTDPSLPAYDSDMSGATGTASVTFSTSGSSPTTAIGTCFTFNGGVSQCGGSSWTTLSSAGVVPTGVLFQYTKSFANKVTSLTAPLNGTTSNRWWATQVNAFVSTKVEGCNTRPWVWIEQ